MKFSKLASKFLSISLGLIFFLTNCVLANISQSNFWSERKKSIEQSEKDSSKPVLLASLPTSPASNPSSILQQLPLVQSTQLTPSISNQLKKYGKSASTTKLSQLAGSIPFLYGNIREISVPANGKFDKTIIHIQDVHLNQEAQNNIGSAIQELINKDAVGLVALEGTSEPIKLDAIRSFPDKAILKEVADYLLQQNKFSGPVANAIANPKDHIPPFLGVDHPQHYKANVDAYKSAISFQQTFKKCLATEEQSIQKEKRSLFNRELLAFDAQVQSYHQNKIQLGAYLKFLSKHIQLTNLTVETFLAAYEMESKMDFSKVESERTRLIKKLVEKLNQDQMQDLARQGIAYRVGQISHTTFYSYLRNLCEKHGVRLADYSAMDAYIQYVLLSDNIKAEELFGETARMEEDGYHKLANSPQEKDLIAKSNYVMLTDKLLDFSLTPNEWSNYKEIAKNSGNPTIGDLKPFESFYVEAEARNDAMTANILKAMDNQKANVAVLVTGGFHSPGINERLKQEKVCTITFVPKITKIDSENGSSYLSIFTQEKTPLEKLFEGEKLFLAENPASPGAVFQFASLVVTKAIIIAKWPFSFLAQWFKMVTNWTLTSFKKVGASLIRLFVTYGPPSSKSSPSDKDARAKSAMTNNKANQSDSGFNMNDPFSLQASILQIASKITGVDVTALAMSQTLFKSSRISLKDYADLLQRIRATNAEPEEVMRVFENEIAQYGLGDINKDLEGNLTLLRAIILGIPEDIEIARNLEKHNARMAERSGVIDVKINPDGSMALPSLGSSIQSSLRNLLSFFRSSRGNGKESSTSSSVNSVRSPEGSNAGKVSLLARYSQLREELQHAVGVLLVNIFGWTISAIKGQRFEPRIRINWTATLANWKSTILKGRAGAALIPYGNPNTLDSGVVAVTAVGSLGWAVPAFFLLSANLWAYWLGLGVVGIILAMILVRPDGWTKTVLTDRQKEHRSDLVKAIYYLFALSVGGSYLAMSMMDPLGVSWLTFLIAFEIFSVIRSMGKHFEKANVPGSDVHRMALWSLRTLQLWHNNGRSDINLQGEIATVNSPEGKFSNDPAIARLASLTREIKSASDPERKAELERERVTTAASYVRGRLEKTNPEIATIVVRYIEDKEKTDIQTLLLEGAHTERVISTLEEIARMGKDSLADTLVRDAGNGESVRAVRKAQGRAVRRTQADVDQKSQQLRQSAVTPFFPPDQWRRLQSDPEGFWKDYWKAESEWIAHRKRMDAKWQRPRGPDADAVERENASRALSEAKALEKDLDAFLNSIVAQAGLSQNEVLNISYRTKSIASLLNKISKFRKSGAEWAKEASIADAVDLIGGRIVVNDLESMEKVLNAIEQRVAQWQINGQGGARILRTENKFLSNDGRPDPYRAVQYIITFPGPNGEQHTFELQVKTFSSMIASDLFHNAVYKADILNLHQALRSAVEDYNWTSDYSEMDAYVSKKAASAASKSSVDAARKLTPDQLRRQLIKKAIDEGDANAFYDLVLSRLDENIYKDKHAWIEVYDWIQSFLATEVDLLKSLDDETVLALATGAHNKGYWETDGVRGAVKNPNSLQVGWDLPDTAYALLTAKGKATYDRRFENFNGGNNKLTTADLDLLSLDVPTRIAFYQAVKSHQNDGLPVIFSPAFEAGLATLTGSEKIMNLYFTTWENMVAQGERIQNREAQSRWKKAIISNQIKAVALTSILTEIGGRNTDGQLRDLSAPAPGASHYTLREKLTHELWVFGDFHYNGEYAYDGLDRNGQPHPKNSQKKDNRAAMSYAEFVEKYPDQRDLDKTIDTAILAKIAERKLLALRARIAATEDPVILAGLVRDRAAIVQKYLSSLTKRKVGEALGIVISDRSYSQIRILLDNGAPGFALAKEIVNQARNQVQAELPVSPDISSVIAAVGALAGLSQNDIRRLSDVATTTSVQSPESGSGWLGRLFKGLLNWIRPTNRGRAVSLKSPEGTSQVQSQTDLKSQIDSANPQKHNFVKDAPILGYRITSDKFEDIPGAIRRHLGATDQTTYTQEYLAQNIGSIIALQMNGDKPDFYVVGKATFDQKYKAVAAAEVGIKNAKVMKKLSAVSGIEELAKSDPNVIGALKTVPVEMIKMSEIGYAVEQEIIIQSPWGEQTKPAGKDAFLVWDGSQNQYYMVNSDDAGLPLSYVAATTVKSPEDTTGWFGRLMNRILNFIRPSVRSTVVQSPEGAGRSNTFRVQAAQLEIIQGDITLVQSDAVVPGMSTEMALGPGITGAIIGAVATISNLNPRNIALMAFPRGNYQVGQAVPASLQGARNRAQWKYVISAMIHSYETAPQVTKETVRAATKNSLIAADKLGLQSLTFGAFGAGILGVPAELSAEWMLSAITEFLNENPATTLRTIKIVSRNGETNAAFLAEAEKSRSHLNSPESGSGWLGRLLSRLVSAFRPSQRATTMQSPEGTNAVQTQADLKGRVDSAKPAKHNFIKDAPILGYRITSDKFEDIPEAIRKHLGETDQTKYTQEYLAQNIGSIIALQMNGDKPDFYVVGKATFDQKYKAVAASEVGAKNAKVMKKLTTVPGVDELAKSDPNIIGALKTVPVEMVRMSDIGYSVGQNVTIQSPWGEQTKPAGKEAYLVWDASQNQYYMVNTDEAGLPISYVAPKITNSRPQEYLDAAGQEKRLPVVSKLIELLNAGIRFMIVGGGGSGKTESLKTALHITSKTDAVFELIGWTLDVLSDEAMFNSAIDNATGSDKETLITFRDTRLLAIKSQTPAGELKKALKKEYQKGSGSTDPYLIKKVENILLRNFSDKIVRDLQNSGKNVIWFDEFDFSITDDLAAIEIDNAKILMGLAGQLQGKHIGIIVHPPARQNETFMQNVRQGLGQSTKADIIEVEMEFLPREIEQAVLGMIGVTGDVAEALMNDLEGIPSAYLGIMTNDDGKRDAYAGIVDPQKKADQIRSDVKKKLAKLEPIIIGKENPRVQKGLREMALGIVPNNLDAKTETEMLRTMFVKRDAQGRLHMPRVVRLMLVEKRLAELSSALTGLPSEVASYQASPHFNAQWHREGGLQATLKDHLVAMLIGASDLMSDPSVPNELKTIMAEYLNGNKAGFLKDFGGIEWLIESFVLLHDLGKMAKNSPKSDGISRSFSGHEEESYQILRKNGLHYKGRSIPAFLLFIIRHHIFSFEINSASDIYRLRDVLLRSEFVKDFPQGVELPFENLVELMILTSTIDSMGAIVDDQGHHSAIDSQPKFLNAFNEYKKLEQSKREGTSINSPESGSGWVGRLLRHLLSLIKPAAKITAVQSPEGTTPIQSQAELKSRIDSTNPQKHNFVKDAPIFGYRITSERFEDLPAAIQNNLGAVDRTKYAEDYLKGKVGSVIVLQMNGAKPDFYPIGHDAFQKYREVSRADVEKKNSKLVKGLTGVEGIDALLKAEDANLIAILKTVPVQMVRMSEIGYLVEQEVTIQAPWGEQTKPAGKEAYLVWDASQNQYYMVNTDDAGLPISYVAATPIQSPESGTGWLGRLLGHVINWMRPANRASMVRSPEGRKNSDQNKNWETEIKQNLRKTQDFYATTNPIQPILNHVKELIDQKDYKKAWEDLDQALDYATDAYNRFGLSRMGYVPEREEALKLIEDGKDEQLKEMLEKAEAPLVTYYEPLKLLMKTRVLLAKIMEKEGASTLRPTNPEELLREAFDIERRYGGEPDRYDPYDLEGLKEQILGEYDRTGHDRNSPSVIEHVDQVMSLMEVDGRKPYVKSEFRNATDISKLFAELNAPKNEKEKLIQEGRSTIKRILSINEGEWKKAGRMTRLEIEDPNIIYEIVRLGLAGEKFSYGSRILQQRLEAVFGVPVAGLMLRLVTVGEDGNILMDTTELHKFFEDVESGVNVLKGPALVQPRKEFDAAALLIRAQKSIQSLIGKKDFKGALKIIDELLLSYYRAGVNSADVDKALEVRSGIAQAEKTSKASTEVKSPESGTGWLGRLLRQLVSLLRPGAQAEVVRSPEGTQSIQSQADIKGRVDSAKPKMHGYVKDAPILGYRITSDRFEDLPAAIRQHLGETDRTKYTQEYLRENIGSIIALQMNGDKPDFYVVGKATFDQKYKAVAASEVGTKNAKVMKKLTAVSGIDELAKSDPNIIGALKTVPVEMVKMSEIGYDMNQEVTIQSPWGEQTKPAGKEAYLVWDASQNQYYMVNTDDVGLPLSYVATGLPVQSQTDMKGRVDSVKPKTHGFVKDAPILGYRITSDRFEDLPEVIRQNLGETDRTKYTPVYLRQNIGSIIALQMNAGKSDFYIVGKDTFDQKYKTVAASEVGTKNAKLMKGLVGVPGIEALVKSNDANLVGALKTVPVEMVRMSEIGYGVSQEVVIKSPWGEQTKPAGKDAYLVWDSGQNQYYMVNTDDAGLPISYVAATAVQSPEGGTGWVGRLIKWLLNFMRPGARAGVVQSPEGTAQGQVSISGENIKTELTNVADQVKGLWFDNVDVLSTYGLNNILKALSADNVILIHNADGTYSFRGDLDYYKEYELKSLVEKILTDYYKNQIKPNGDSRGQRFHMHAYIVARVVLDLWISSSPERRQSIVRESIERTVANRWNEVSKLKTVEEFLGILTYMPSTGRSSEPLDTIVPIRKQIVADYLKGISPTEKDDVKKLLEILKDLKIHPQLVGGNYHNSGVDSETDETVALAKAQNAFLDSLRKQLEVRLAQTPIQTQTNMKERVAVASPHKHNFIKDAPILGYRITSDRFEDIPEAIRKHLGETDQTKYTQEYLAQNIGSIIALQMNGDKPDFYVVGKPTFDQKYKPVAAAEVATKNAKVMKKLTAVSGIDELAKSDPNIIGALKTVPVEMIKMSEIGYAVDQAVTIQSPWGEQTKPAGKDAFLVWDGSQNQYYMVNTDEAGLPLSYVAATTVKSPESGAGWLTRLLKQILNRIRSAVAGRAASVKSPEGVQRSPEVKILASNLVELAQVLALRDKGDRTKESVVAILTGDRITNELHGYYANGGFKNAANQVDIRALIHEVDDLVASKVREGSLSEYEVQSVLIQLGFLGIPSQILTKLIGNKEFAIAVSAEDIPWIKEFRKALPSVKLVLVIDENEKTRFEQDLKKGDPAVKLWAQSKGNLFETKTDQNGHTARVINLAYFEAGIASGLNVSQTSPQQVKALLDNIAVGFRGGVTFNADGIGPNSLLSQVEKVILDSLFQGMRVQVSLNDFVELAKKLAIQA